MNAATQATVLNVDDQEALRYVKTRDLQQAGFAVLEASTGTEALRMVEHHKPPIVLLDVHLPDMIGYEVCKQIKQKWPSTMILMTSATFTTSDDRIYALDSGADSFLAQPAEPLELVAAINALLRIRRTEGELGQLTETLERRVQDRTAELGEANEKLKNEIAQREKAEAALVQAEKMHALGQLTGGLAHDFNNLLTAVLGSFDLIRRYSRDAQIQRLADSGLSATRRGAKLTAQLLAFSRAQELTTVPVDVNGLIAGMRDMLNQTLGASITVNAELDPKLPPAMGDVNQLELAILNLSINARDAMPGGGTLTIATAIASDEPNTVTIAVSDTGCGMPPEVAKRAFDPFYTTKPAGQGTGLGLSQVYGIVKQSGGNVMLESEMGKGTTVTMRLPRAEVNAVSVSPTDVSTLPAGRSEKLLIVDDDADVRQLLTPFLSNLGYEVSEATSGEDALSILGDCKPDMMIIDFAMEGMNGAEAALAARQRYPGIPILFISGFADAEALRSAVDNAPLVHKPFRPAELAAAVRSILDAPPHQRPEAQ
jgi:DNA-binding response OmpR family regulator/anti-sigma regulatory factor (Ser/Thr protein kinase)